MALDRMVATLDEGSRRAVVVRGMEVAVEVSVEVVVW